MRLLFRICCNKVNYLGPFLLTELLLPALRQSEYGKVINVASAASTSACDWGNRPDGCMNSFELWRHAATTRNGSVAPSPPPCGPGFDICNDVGTPASNYGLTKFAQVAHALELNAREKSSARSNGTVQAFSLHPGFVETPMTRDIAPQTAKEWCAPLPYSPGICPINATAGAATQTYLVGAVCCAARGVAWRGGGFGVDCGRGGVVASSDRYLLVW